MSFWAQRVPGRTAPPRAMRLTGRRHVFLGTAGRAEGFFTPRRGGRRRRERGRAQRRGAGQGAGRGGWHGALFARGGGAGRGGRRGRQPGGHGGEPRRAARQAARRSLWADAAALHGKARPPAQARAWSGRGARTAAPPAPTLGKKRRMQDYAVFCAACPPARTSYAQRQPPKKQGIVDNVVDNVDKSAARMWKIPLHTRPPHMQTCFSFE